MALIDLNADVGERAGPACVDDDAAILDSVTSANIACGFHAGDPSTMRVICQAAIARGVRIGAHVGYQDRPGFGRRELAIAPARLRDETIYQLGALAACAAACGGRLSYLKPHGALYARCAQDRTAAAAVAEAAAGIDPPIAVLGPPGSELLAAAAQRGLAGAAEGFADRAYLSDGRLASRDRPGSVLSAPEALAQAEQIARRRAATTVDGGLIRLEVVSLCLHSDTPGAAGLARAVRTRLELAGVKIGAFA